MENRSASTPLLDVAIIGAGIAGLAAAWELTACGRSCVVLEARPRAGGVILTERADGFVIDAGPDALLVQKPAGVALARELGLGDRLVPTSPPRTAFVVRNDRLVPLPETSFLGIPTRIGPLVTTPLFSWPGKLRMALEVFIPSAQPPAWRGEALASADAGGPEGPPLRGASDVIEPVDESIGSFMRRRFGQEVVDYLAEPLLAGIHAGDVEQLSMRALFPRLLEAERTSGSLIRSLRALQTTRPATGAFLSFIGGLDELVTTLVQKLPEGTVRCGTPVARVTGRGPFAVALDDGTEVEARAVIAATPARVTASLLDSIDGELAALCRQARYTSTGIVVLGYRRDQVRHPLAGSGFVVPRVERRFLMAATWVSSKWPHRAPEGHVLLRGFVGGAHDPHAMTLDDDEIVARAADELASRLDIAGAPLLARVYRWTDATAQHEVGHHRWLAALDTRVAATPGLFLTGSSYRGTGIPDCVADARDIAARADEQLRAADSR